MITRRDGEIHLRQPAVLAPVPAFRRDGEDLDAGTLAAILLKARAGVVEAPIEFTAQVYRQRIGEPLTPGRQGMQQHTMFRPSIMRGLARSFRGKPFLDGHEWSSSKARGGTITDSALDVETGETENRETRIVQDVTATEPWAVAGVLSGTVEKFSIGGVLTGEIHCSIHKAKIFDGCWCLPGEMVGDPPEDGEPDKRKRAQWIIQAAEGVEVSAVNVPAVGGSGTGIQTIRAGLVGDALDADIERDAIRALALSQGASAHDIRAAFQRPTKLPAPARRPRSVPMSRYNRLAAALQLAVPPGDDLDEDRALASVDGLRAERDLFRARAEDAERRLGEIDAQNAAAALDGVIAAAYTDGRMLRTIAADGVTPVPDAQEASLRRIGQGLGLDALKAHIAAMPARRTPARVALSEVAPAPTPNALPEPTPSMRIAASQLGIPVEEVVRTAVSTGRL